MIRKCTDDDLAALCAIINDAAQAYKSVIPDDRWREPYMPVQDLRQELRDGVEFWGYESDGELSGVMGIQDKGDVDLIRHAYVKTSRRNQGVGTRLLCHLEKMTSKPILIGTWADASWAIRFYEKNGYRLLSAKETERLLRRYWSIPDRQIVTSVVLANAAWKPETKAKPVHYKLVIVAASPTTDIWLADDGGHLVQKEIGTLRTRILPGFYTVEFGLGNLTYPLHLTKASRYTQAEITAGPPCPRPKVRLLPE